MSPEELEAAREGANVDYAPDISYDDWQAMAKALLAHINQQEATIENLKAALDEVKLDRVNFSSACQEEIEALKDKLVSEKAYHLYYKCQGDCDRVICSAGAHTSEARKKLAKEMPEVEWK